MFHNHCRAGGHRPACEAGAVLIVTPDAGVRAELRCALRGAELLVEFASTLAQADDAMEQRTFNAIVCDDALPDACGSTLLRLAAATRPEARTILLTREPSVDRVVEAMRLGAVDLLRTAPLDGREALASIRAAVSRSRNAPGRSKQQQEPSRGGGRTDASPPRAPAIDGAPCAAWTDQTRPLAHQVNDMPLASEFTALIRQELDIEDLLRKALEFMLQQIGPTNAAIYLPSNHSDFSLGAYVNYDYPRDAADMLLEHLADVLPAQFQDEQGVRRFASAEELAERLGDDHMWIERSCVLVTSCRHEEECLAVLVLFRDDAQPYNEDTAEQVELMGGLFAEQLARVIRIHHRCDAAEQELGWDADDEFGDDYGDLAA